MSRDCPARGGTKATSCHSEGSSRLLCFPSGLFRCLMHRFPQAARDLLSCCYQVQGMEFFGKGYNRKGRGYICVDQLGNLIEPNYVTQHFPILLKNSKLRRIRFHDLRHSCASLLLANGISMKEIQEWLGHSNFSTTANIYAHLDASSKQISAKTLSGVFGFSLEPKKEC